jgi:hypothetical protein
MSTNNYTNNQQRLAIYYEHPEWFRPLFNELDQRGVAYDRLTAHLHYFDPSERQSPYALIVNRMSPSAHTRGHSHAIFYTLQYLSHLKDIGAKVLNGYDAYVYEFSKARQLDLLTELGIRHPRARVINHASQAYPAANGLVYPLVIKPNIGGSGAGILRFENPEELEYASRTGEIDMGLDGTALVQEYLPARDDSIVRVEVLNGEFLYAIRLYLSQGTFNLCPADYCEIPEPGMRDGVSGRNLLVEAYTPPGDIIEQVKRITRKAHIEVGGVEYLINDRDGECYFYDINALSNFVADAPNVIGFDPFPRLVDFILERAGLEVHSLA